MKRNKQPRKTPSRPPENDEMKPRLPAGVIYILFPLWVWFVLSHYFRTVTAGTMLPYFAPLASGDMTALTARLWEHAVNIFYALIIFTGAYGLGSTLVGWYLSRRNTVAPDVKPAADAVAPDAAPDNDTRLLFSIAMGLGMLALVTLGAGLAGLLYKSIFLPLLIVLAVIGAIRLKSDYRSAPLSFTFTEKIALMVFAVIFLINLIGALTPELFFDSQLYQLGLMNHWALEHRIESSNFLIQSYFPLNVNMLYLAALVVRNEITAKIIHLFMGLLLAGGIFTLVRRYFSRKAAVFAALIFYAVPLVMAVSWKTAIELGIGVFEFTTVFALLEFSSSRRNHWLIAAGIMCGFSLGSKYTSLAFCYVPALVTIIAIGAYNKERPASIIRTLFVFSLTALIVSLPWYLKNVISTGNPVFPYLWQNIGFEKVRMTGSLFADPPHPKFSVHNYLLFLWPMTMGTLQQETFPGVAFLVFVPFIFLFGKLDRRIKLLGVYAVSSFLFWVLLGRFYLRYFIPSLAVISVVYGYFIVHQKIGATFNQLVLWLVIATALANIGFSNMILRATQDPVPYVLGHRTKKEYLSTQRPSFPDAWYQTLEYANRTLPPDARILYIGETRGLYAERRFVTHGVSDFSHLIEWTKLVDSGDGLYSKLKANGVTHILFNVPEARRISSYDIFYWNDRDIGVFHAFWNKYVKEIYRDIGDLAIPEKGIYSLKSQQPEYWRHYAQDPAGFVYLYEIMSEEDASKPHQPPADFLLDKRLYAAERLKQLTLIK